MRYVGKLIGALIGLALFRHPLGLVIGLVIGHAVDAGWLLPPRKRKRDRDETYSTLGLTRDAADDEVERAYRRLVSQYHPDKVANAAEEIRQLAERRMRDINTAYEAILRERRRE